MAAAASLNGTILCATLEADSAPEMLEQMQAAKATGANAAEVRLDCIREFNPSADLAWLVKNRPLPVIVAYRPTWDGGLFDGDEASRIAALRLATELGADFVEIELKVARDFITAQTTKSSSTKIIVSHHNLAVTPSTDEIASLVAEIQSTGAHVVKFVTTAQNVADSANAFRVLAHSQVATIGIVLGEKGIITRLLAPKFGGFLTYAPLKSAYGQRPLTELVNTYRLPEMNSDTRVYGIIGETVGHSKGPYLHNPSFAEIGYNAVYVPFMVDNIADFLRVYSAVDFVGFSISFPFKGDAVQVCDEVEPIGLAIGAVNTLVRRDGKLRGYNTDCEAAVSAIEDEMRFQMNLEKDSTPIAGKRCVVMGAGGAGKAIAFGLQQRGGRVVIANRNFERGKVLAESIGAEAIPLESLESFQPETGMILANATSLGMNINDTPIPKAALKAYSVVFDAVYTPPETRLLREAKECGAIVVSGIEMFIRQAIAQFELFTCQPAPKAFMRETIMKITREQNSSLDSSSARMSNYAIKELKTVEARLI